VAKSVDKIFQAEAKARYTSVSFANAERRQFSRVAVKDRSQRHRGTQFVTHVRDELVLHCILLIGVHVPRTDGSHHALHVGG
jgi:hypothetical protein